ncbi:MAG: mycothiol synthase, partial [Stackebrandtia sp.]
MKTYDRLDTDAVADVLELVRIGDNADGLAAANEQTLLKLRHGDSGHISHIQIREDCGLLSGYANLDRTDPATAALEMLVHPLHRHNGRGGALLAEAIRLARESGHRAIHVWAHGDHPIALALADEYGFDRARVLWQMRRRLTDDEPIPVLPDNVTIRAFIPGRDEQRLLSVNNIAFADHPEQGTWTVRDIAMRERESWFDAAGLLLAERDDGELLGFHWTKVHDADSTAIGEIYVLGVHPDAQGLKLGTALTAAGLRYLRGRGLDRVMLYVDEDNT